MIYDGFDFSGLLRCNPSRRLLPPVSAASLSMPGADGQLAGAVTLGAMTVQVSARVLGRSSECLGFERFAELRRALAGRLLRREPAWLVLDDDPTMRLRALMVDAPELDAWWPGASVTLRFRCDDPVAYGAARSVELAEGTSEVVVGGTYAASPTFEVRARAGEAVRVADVGSGRFVQVAAAGTARTVTVACGRYGRCEVNGEPAPELVSLASRYFTLEPGRRQVSVEGGPATMTYDERWL